MDILSVFKDAVEESIKKKGHRLSERNNYYDENYVNHIREDFERLKVKSLEVNYSNRYKCTPICSISSSGRLCYLYFRKKNVEFEQTLNNDINSNTKMDACKDNVFYECKCQELMSKSHDQLSANYLNSDLFKELIKNRVDEVEKSTIIIKKDGKEKTKDVLNFDLNLLLGLEKSYGDYSKQVFDYKQLICHLIAIANSDKNNKVGKELRYIIFKPDKDKIKPKSKLETRYNEFDEEFKLLTKANTPIGDFCKHHNITISNYISVDIGEVDDFVLDELNKKTLNDAVS